MPKEEWGTKRLCPHCATRFYDLKADPMTCPACGNTFTVTSLTDGRGKTLVTEKTAAANDDDELVDDEEDIADDAGEIFTCGARLPPEGGAVWRQAKRRQSIASWRRQNSPRGTKPRLSAVSRFARNRSPRSSGTLSM